MNWWNKFSKLVPLVTGKDVFFLARKQLYRCFVQSYMLHGSEIRPVKEESEMEFLGRLGGVDLITLDGGNVSQ